MDILNIEHERGATKGSFYIGGEPDRLAEVVYNWAGSDRIIVEHTFVDESLRGKGIAAKLIADVVDFARREHLKVVPLCPYAKSVLMKGDNYQDIL